MNSRRLLVAGSLAGVGLIVVGSAMWAWVTGAAARDPSRPTDFTAVPVYVDFAAPPLALSDLNGEQHSLKDSLGRVVLVNLWATWCPPCAAEMPVFQLYYERHQAEGFTVIAVNDGEAARDVATFATAHQLTFPIWLDPNYTATDHAFKAANLPTSYVIDRQGRVRLMWIGAISSSNLEKFVTPLIEE